MNLKNKWIAVLLNLFMPGLGNLYARNWKRALTFYALFLLILVVSHFIAYSFTLLCLALFIALGFVIFTAVSSYKAIPKDKIYTSRGYDKWFVYVLLIFLQAIFIEFVPLPLIEKFSPIHFAKIPVPNMEPNLMIGDQMAYVNVNTLERNKVCIFKFPDDPQLLYVERCVAIPGDTIAVNGGKVWVNGALDTCVNTKNLFKVTTIIDIIDKSILKELNIQRHDMEVETEGTYYIMLHQEQLNKLKENKNIYTIEPIVNADTVGKDYIYPQSTLFNWNMDFYGPFYVPKKGDKISLTDKNIALYLKCIINENKQVEKGGEGLMVNGTSMSTYEFKENYYFMLGDNRSNSMDSRFWGLVPEKLIVGKPLYILWSKTFNRIGQQIQ